VLSQMRSGDRNAADAALAEITADMDIIENHVYHRLLLMFAGELPSSAITPAEQNGVQNATAAYGIAAWMLITGGTEERAEARRRFQQIVEAAIESGAWAAFGCIAAEAELARTN
jgi:hypothetical protein